jgi:hypothetical protein
VVVAETQDDQGNTHQVKYPLGEVLRSSLGVNLPVPPPSQNTKMPMFSGPKKSAAKLNETLGQNDIRQIMKGVMVVHHNQEEESIGDVDIEKNSLDESSASI